MCVYCIVCIILGCVTVSGLCLDCVWTVCVLYTCDCVWTVTPDEMLLTGILPIPKGTSSFNPANSRGISMIPVITKLFNRMLLDRIRCHVEPLLRFNQNGFRPERGTREQIFAIRRIIEEVIRYNLPAVMTFIDFSKAFDSILRSKLPEILAAYRIPPLIIKAILALYTNTKARVMTPEGITMEFLTNLGILQGDVLAPFIFIVVLDYILRNSVDKDPSLGLTLHKARSRRYPAIHLSDLDFADDLAAISDSIVDNTQLCQSIADTAAMAAPHSMDTRWKSNLSRQLTSSYSELLLNSSTVKQFYSTAPPPVFDLLQGQTQPA